MRLVAITLGLSLCVLSIAATHPAYVQEADAEQPRPFYHSDHVSAGWLDGKFKEVARDCLGCHDKEVPAKFAGGQSSSVGLCATCHFRFFDDRPTESTFEPQAAAGFESDLSPLDETSGAFLHGDHQTLSCYECHAPDDGKLSAGEPLPIRAGEVECRRCHDPKLLEQGGPTAAFALRVDEPGPDGTNYIEDFLQFLNTSESMRPDRLGPFRHGDHLREPDLVQGFADLFADDLARDACSTCHPVAQFERAGRAFAQAPFVVSTCASCHIDQDGADGEFLQGATTRPSAAALTFDHTDHLVLTRPTDRDTGVGDAGAARVRDQGCYACHNFQRGAVVEDIGYVDDVFLYEGCVACHTGATWNTRQHGEWDSCESCHDFAADAPMQEARPVVDVTGARRRPASFKVEVQSHPFISADDYASQDCGECHRAPVQALPSRIQELPFRHATHLAAEVGADSCDLCHLSRVAEAGSSRAIGQAAEPGLMGLTYDPASCVQCHLGDAPTPVFAEQAPRQVVPEFPHAKHMNRSHPSGLLEAGCAACHPADGLTADQGIGTSAEAKACNSCHNHAEFADHTDGLGGTDATSCAQCHDRIPAIEQSFDLQAHRITGGTYTQLHPLDRSCEDCHFSGEVSLRLLPVGNIAAIRGLSRGRKDVHKDPGTSVFEADDCISCHWREFVRGMSSQYSPERLSTREQFGNVLDGYPGTEKTR